MTVMLSRQSINEWIALCHRDAVAEGRWEGLERTNPNDLAVKIAIIHSQVSGALEGIRTGDLDRQIPTRKAVEVALAAALIRIYDLAGSMELDLEGAVVEKRAYNRTRIDHAGSSNDKTL